MNPSTAALAVERLTKSYGRARGVIDLTFTVMRGEVFGYLGPNGAGKTTTIRTLLDFIRPTDGRASVLGLDARRDSVEIQRRVGYRNPDALANGLDPWDELVLAAIALIATGIAVVAFDRRDLAA